MEACATTEGPSGIKPETRDAPGRSALVTGATGFLGSHLLRHLVRGGWRAHALIRSSSGQGSPAFEEVRDVVTLHAFEEPLSNAQGVVAEVRPDAVFHIAAVGGYGHAPHDVGSLIAVNVLLGTQLLEGLRGIDGAVFVCAGTPSQHYLGEDYNPASLYAATKQAFADILRYYIEVGSVKASVLEIGDTYGPQDRREKLLNLLRRAVDSGVAVALSEGDQLIDFVYIDDMVRAFEMAAVDLLSGGLGGVYSVSSRDPISVRELVAIYSEVEKATIPVEFGKRPYRDREMMRPWSGGVPLPRWHPQVGIFEGLSRVHDAR